MKTEKKQNLKLDYQVFSEALYTLGMNITCFYKNIFL